MLLGISSSLKHETPIQWAEQMVELGCSAVIFPVDYTASDKTIANYLLAAKQYNLTIAEVGIWNNPIALPENERKKAWERCVGQLRLADEIGAKCCVNITGTIGGPIWDGGYRENFSQKTWDQVVESIQLLLDEVKPVHTVYSVEPMPWMIPGGPDEYLRLIHAVNREQFKVHMDLVNMITTPDRYFFAEEFMQECFDLLGDLICSCHLKDIRLLPQYTFQLEEVACGEGSLNLEHYISLANQYNPDMPMIIEHLHTDDEYRRSVEYLKDRIAKSEIGREKQK